MPKKTEEKKEKLYLGRPSNNVSIGIVGMPNVGKSTLFNALSKLNVAAENYPFCTIDPHVAKVPVPDDRFDFLVQHHHPKSVIPAVLTVTDIAGLVAGAHEGKGLGNAFLSNITAVDAIYHVVRAFKSREIEHVEGSVDPVRDLQIISDELLMKDLERAKTHLASVQHKVTRGIDKSKEMKDELDTMTRAVAMLEAKTDIREGDWNATDVVVLNRMQFLSAKPVVYLVNISEKGYITKKNKWLGKIHQWVQTRTAGAPIIPFSAEFEGKLVALGEDEATAYCTEQKTQSVLPKVIKTGYKALRLIYFFTGGPKEVRAWTIKQGTKAPGAAGTIHTDFERCFVCAKTMTFDDFKTLGSEAAVKAAGKYRAQGKAYEVLDGDIIYFEVNTGGKKK